MRSRSTPKSCCNLVPGQSFGFDDDRRSLARILDQSGSRRPCPAPIGVADAHPRPRLRSRRLSAARFALARRGAANILQFDLPPSGAADTKRRDAITAAADLEPAHPAPPAGQNGPAALYDDDRACRPPARAYPRSRLPRSRARRGSTVRVDQRQRQKPSSRSPCRSNGFARCAARCCCRREGGDIDKLINRRRAARRFSVSSWFRRSIMLVLSLLLAGTIAEPMRRLAEAAERVRRRGTKSRHEIPDFTSRSDEIGHLSGALRDMTKRALWSHRGDRKLRCRCRRMN